jgi:hypothetical protein
VIQNGGRVFLTWNDSRRSESLARVIGLDRILFVPRLRGWQRHVRGFAQTAAYLFRVRPNLIWYQFSLGLGVAIALYALVCRRKRVVLVADVHTKALRRNGSSLLRPMVRRIKAWSLGFCRAAIVTNEENATYAWRTFGVKALILSDPLPMPRPPVGAGATKRFDVLVVCSYAADEPLDLIEQLASKLRAQYTVAITGDVKHLNRTFHTRLKRVALLTGWLGECEYWDCLRNARAILVLSTESACLPCGAYEAIAVGNRPIVRDDPFVKEAFGQSAVYTSLSVTDIEIAIQGIITERVASASRDVAADFEANWRARWESIYFELNSVGAVV